MVGAWNHSSPYSGTETGPHYIIYIHNVSLNIKKKWIKLELIPSQHLLFSQSEESRFC
jgi:hypothetical protein